MYYNTGVVDYTAGISIANTADPDLYRSQRWTSSPSLELNYTIPLFPGNFILVLHFSDNCFCTVLPGTRVFNVTVQGQAVPTLTNFDIIAVAGWRSAHVVTVPGVSVGADRLLTVAFIHIVQNPTIAAIEVYLYPDATTPTTTTPTPLASGVALFRINAGGSLFVDSLGQTWITDTYNNGVGGTYSTRTPIPNVARADQPLYLSEHFGYLTPPWLLYTFPVSPAINAVRVRLYFIEIYPPAAYVGYRMFNVLIQNTIVLENYDIYADVGLYVPVVKEFVVSSLGLGQLDISFQAPSYGTPYDGPKISGIEILVA